MNWDETTLIRKKDISCSDNMAGVCLIYDWCTWKWLWLWIGAVAKGLQDTQIGGTLYLWEKTEMDTKLQ